MSTLKPTTDGADRAFPTHPRLDRYFPSASAEESRLRLTSCVERGEGPALLIGSAGSGKTMLLEAIADAFAERFAVARLGGGQLCTRRALLQSLLHALELPHRDREEGELRLALLDYLQDRRACPAGVLLLVDEAHALAPRLLDEVRGLGNLASGGAPLVRVILAGTTKLEERLADPSMEPLNQRIAARCYLAPLTYDELVQYVRGHIAAAGADPDELLSGDAAAAVFEATDGIPRLINQLCDRAIVLAVDAGAQVIDRAAIQNAWSDLHQLPAPWHAVEPPVPPAEFDNTTSEAAPTGIDDTLDTPTIEAGAAPLGDWNADAALTMMPVSEPPATAEPEPAAAAADELGADQSAADEPLTANPFGDSFEEEETLIDPYAGFDTPFPPGLPVVTNQEDNAFSTLVASLAPIADHDATTDTDEETELDEPEDEPADELPAALPTAEPAPVGLAFPIDDAPSVDATADDEAEELVDDEAFLAVASIDVGEDPAVLLIEDEVAAAAPTVRRQEYRQLFAGLRGG